VNIIVKKFTESYSAQRVVILINNYTNQQCRIYTHHAKIHHSLSIKQSGIEMMQYMQLYISQKKNIKCY